MKIYADYEFYVAGYLLGRKPKIPKEDFQFWAMQASSGIQRVTFGRMDDMKEIPEDVKMCCCEVAEKMCVFDSMKEEDGRILQSYNNDGESGTYATTDMTDAALEGNIYRVIHKWLAPSGLMYCGVER